jgi:iron-sulfur cluster assembly accessory protein
MITLTETATSEINTLLEREGKQGYGLRIRVVGGGCSGLQYQMGLEKEPKAEDRVFESHGMKLFIDPKSAVFLAGVKVDFVHALNGSGFKIENPNAQSSCGCGKSFN